MRRRVLKQSGRIGRGLNEDNKEEYFDESIDDIILDIKKNKFIPSQEYKNCIIDMSFFGFRMNMKK